MVGAGGSIESKLITTNKFYLSVDGIGGNWIVKEFEGTSLKSSSAGFGKPLASGQNGRAFRAALPGVVELPETKFTLYSRSDDDSLHQWHIDCTPQEGGQASWGDKKKDMTLRIYDPDGKNIVKSFVYSEAYPINWELGKVDATSSEPLTEILTVVHTGMKSGK